MSAIRVLLDLEDGQQILADLSVPGGPDGLLRLAPREPVTITAGQRLTLRLNTADLR